MTRSRFCSSGYSVTPNFDAVLFFCTRVLPLLRQDAPERFRVLVVGRAGYDLNELTAIEEVQLVLNPPDVAPYYTQRT
jgi:hypothetical protein